MWAWLCGGNEFSSVVYHNIATYETSEHNFQNVNKFQNVLNGYVQWITPVELLGCLLAPVMSWGEMYEAVALNS